MVGVYAEVDIASSACPLAYWQAASNVSASSGRTAAHHVDGGVELLCDGLGFGDLPGGECSL